MTRVTLQDELVFLLDDAVDARRIESQGRGLAPKTEMIGVAVAALLQRHPQGIRKIGAVVWNQHAEWMGKSRFVIGFLRLG